MRTNTVEKLATEICCVAMTFDAASTSTSVKFDYMLCCSVPVIIKVVRVLVHAVGCLT